MHATHYAEVTVHPRDLRQGDAVVRVEKDGMVTVERLCETLVMEPTC